MKFLKSLLRNKKGAALVEYGLLVAGVALVTAAAVSIFGHKTNDLLATTAGILPGAHGDDNNPIVSGKIIETTQSNTIQNGAGDGGQIIDLQGILLNSGNSRVGDNMGFNSGLIEEMVLEAP